MKTLRSIWSSAHLSQMSTQDHLAIKDCMPSLNRSNVLQKAHNGVIARVTSGLEPKKSDDYNEFSHTKLVHEDVEAQEAAKAACASFTSEGQ